jgi:hypothetical protein
VLSRQRLEHLTAHRGGLLQITFTNDGTPITFPDLDTTIDGPPTTTPVPVYEIQTIVTGTE